MLPRPGRYRLRIGSERKRAEADPSKVHQLWTPNPYPGPGSQKVLETADRLRIALTRVYQKRVSAVVTVDSGNTNRKFPGDRPRQIRDEPRSRGIPIITSLLS